MIVFLNLLFTDAIFAGITAGMNKGKINYQFGEVVVEPAAGGDYIKKADEIVEKFKDDFRVEKVSQILEFGVTLVNQKEKDGRDEKRQPAFLMGMDTGNEGRNFVFDMAPKIVDGRMLRDDDRGKIILGTELAGGYGVSVFPDDLGGVKVGDKILVERGGKSAEFQVVGIFKTKNFDMDMRAFVPEKELRRMVGLYSGADRIIFRLKDKKQAKSLVADLKKAGYGKYDIADWEEKLLLGAAISKSFEMIGTILRIIGSLVAGLVIFIIIFVDIVNNRRQVGILKAMGVRQNSIIYSYVFRGLFYALLGSLFGYFLMNYGIIGAFRKNPLDMPMADVVPLLKEKALLMSVIFFITAGIVGSAVPAYREIRKRILTLLYH